MKIKLCTITCANAQFREQRQVVELDSRHIKLSMTSSAIISCHLKMPMFCPNTWRKEGWWKQVDILINEDFGPCTV
jgi:hypothetical protein